ncbi:putative signal-transduction protein [Caenispirillum salinarum AK4]|uniref:Putative signal-transduction protein n=1 Tax=Caenispirillum salinarum AK4 TaxID=1238182 RepID=K9GP29_9PROT|nr:CBS domain-containing protein [Caenispirillum salinarum]EKV26902.1 putative signal-transduction protein [Caenispirillum salinarum AK4]
MAKIVPDIIPREQTLSIVAPETTVRTAAELMRDRNIAAVMIVRDERLIGIMTERDIAARAVARGVDPQTTRVEEIMTADPDTLEADDPAMTALKMMREHNYRHLPVVKDGRPVGMVSIRDLYAVVQSELESDIRNRDAYIFGENYGTAPA